MYQHSVETPSLKFFLLLTLIVPAYTDFNPDLFCSFIANNTKIKDPTACNKYITCVDQKPITAICEDDFFYDRNARKCVAANTVTCYSSNPCAAQPKVNGFVESPYTCNSYFYCHNGQATEGFCSAGMYFNPTTKNCVRNYECIDKILPDDYCNIVPDDVFIKVPKSCTAYQVCWHGRLINGTCPDTFYFDALRGECRYVTDGECEENPSSLPNVPANIKCTQPGVFIPDSVSCNGYYYCKGNGDGSIQLIPAHCPFYRFFDSRDGGACVLRFNVTCKHNRCVTLGYNGIQLANRSGDGCTGFLICENGEIIGQSECPSGQYFNEISQMCTSKLVAYPACNNATASALIGE